jgi:hypothetical protein
MPKNINFFSFSELQAAGRPRPASASQSVLLVLTPSSSSAKLPPDASAVDLHQLTPDTPPPPRLNVPYAIVFSLTSREILSAVDASLQFFHSYWTPRRPPLPIIPCPLISSSKILLMLKPLG